MTRKIAQFENGKLVSTFSCSTDFVFGDNYVDVTDIDYKFNTVDAEGIPVWVEPAYDHIKAQQGKLQEVRAYFNGIAVQAASSAAKFEKDSWETQRQEWLRYRDNVDALTPYCDTLAASRGITKEELMTKIEAKVLGFAALQGQLHAIEDAINATTTQEELEAIVWS